MTELPFGVYKRRYGFLGGRDVEFYTYIIRNGEYRYGCRYIGSNQKSTMYFTERYFRKTFYITPDDNFEKDGIE